MARSTGVQTHQAVEGVPTSNTFSIEARAFEDQDAWSWIPAYSSYVARIDITCNKFKKYPIAVAAFNMEGRKRIQIRVKYTGSAITSVKIRPVALGIQTAVMDGTITFELNESVDVMLEINDDKYQSLHILTNEIELNAPITDSANLWYFGPGLNAGSAYSKAIDGTITVPSDTTVYLALGAFVTAKFVFSDVSNSCIIGHGFIYKTPVIHTSTFYPRELNNSAILIERSTNISVSGVTSLGANGFSLPVCQSSGITINRYRSFSSGGNGDGIDLFCCRNVLIQRCFLRNSDDTIAIYGHRWGYNGDTENIRVKGCMLLPDIAHPVQVGTHGCPEKPERLSNIHISDIDILDHEENQLWYQGCISVNAGDENLVEDVLVENVRVEKITKGQLFNIRVMQNAMWTTAPGRGVRNITLRNVELLSIDNSGIINPSQILGYDGTRRVEGVLFENLKVSGNLVHESMPKPRWYMVEDLVPMFVNEHAVGVKFVWTEHIGKGEAKLEETLLAKP